MHALLNRTCFLETLDFLCVHRSFYLVGRIFHLGLDQIPVVGNDVVIIPSLSHLAEEVVHLLGSNSGQPQGSSSLGRSPAFLPTFPWASGSNALFSALGVLFSPSDSTRTHHDFILLTFLSSLELEELVGILVLRGIVLRHSFNAKPVVPVRLSGASILRA